MSSQKTEHYELNQWLATDQVLRTDFNADNAKIDGALAEHAQKLDWLGSCRIETGSYVGTGEYGESHPNSLTFSGKPLVLIIGGVTAEYFIVIRGTGNHVYTLSSTISNTTYYTWSENSISWYTSTGSEAHQQNESGKTYLYVAILSQE